jgi:hypothetical protein
MSISYVICTCNADFTSTIYDLFTSDYDFNWPALGKFHFSHFNANKNKYGAGLLGFLNGCGNGASASWADDAQWLLVAVPTNTIIEVGVNVKFPKGEVIFSSQDRFAVIAELERLNPETRHMPIIGAYRVSMLKGANVLTGDFGTSTSGNEGTSTSGNDGTSVSGRKGSSTSGDSGISTTGDGGISISKYNGKSTSGDGGTSISEDYGTSISGDNGKSTSGELGNSTSGDYGLSTSGDHGTSTSGDHGTSISGDLGNSISGDRGTSISGSHGTSTVGLYGKAKSGLNGNLVFFYTEDGKTKRCNSFFVDGINVKADTFYLCYNGELREEDTRFRGLSGISYVISTCNSDFTSYNGIRWPALGKVECADFEDTNKSSSFRPELRGILNGCGEGIPLFSLSRGPSTQWLLVAVPSDTIVDSGGGYVTFPRGEVIFSSQDRFAVLAELERLNPETRDMLVVIKPQPPPRLLKVKKQVGCIGSKWVSCFPCRRE